MPRSWPLNGEVTFGELLINYCQFVHLQSWARLTQGWCEWHVSTSKFLLAYSYLNTWSVQPYGANNR